MKKVFGLLVTFTLMSSNLALADSYDDYNNPGGWNSGRSGNRNLPSPINDIIEIYGYNTWFPQELDKYFEKVDASPNSSLNMPKCAPVTERAVSKGLIDIRYALGYFDDSQGHDVVWNNKNYGLSPSLDIAVYNVTRKWLTKKCPFNARMLCEFKEIGDPRTGLVRLEKEIFLQGKRVKVSIRLTHASASEIYSQNLSELAYEQKRLSEQSEMNFFGGLEEADMVFYNGHSRNGGGPDFNPPRLNSLRKTDYEGYYKKVQPGFNRLLAAITQNPNPGFFLGMFSCFSYRHFYKKIISTNPKQRLVLTSDEIDYLQSFLASMSYMEGLLQGSCGEELAQFAKKDAKMYDGFKGYHIK